ncbi:hypothetical protein SUGI_0569890 [Cryptomeria japonica]|nr:hypothetical protein SUGI_0569890 [Cryptomeria japonica]
MGVPVVFNLNTELPQTLVYLHQIQALSALSRLFRGRKRNPRHARIDSFDYSVEQLVVGSLVFTPLLLLVPTTSIFYVFFTILNTVVSLACIGLQFLISSLHAFFALIAIWLVHPKRFPSGKCQMDRIPLVLPGDSEIVVSSLGINSASLG